MTTLIKTSKPNGWVSRPSVFSSPFSVLDEIMKDDLFPALNNDLLGMDFSSHMPAVNISEEADRYHVELSAPGFSKENFRVQVDDGKLVISAENKVENKTESKKYSRKEFSCGTFRKSFQLSDDVQQEKITANYENGILNISIPKMEEEKPKPAQEIIVG